MSFERVYEYTKRFEGGYVNKKNDKGGETFRGITRRSFPNWPGWKLIDQAKAKGNTSASKINAFFKGDKEMDELVERLYYNEFWQPMDAKLQAGNRITEKMFDVAVNTGFKGAGTIIQKAINKHLKPIAILTVDGAIGPRTSSAVALAESHYGEAKVIEAIIKEQEAYYRAIVRRDPSQEEFLAGWLNRSQFFPAE